MYEQLKAIMIEVLLLDPDGVRPEASREGAGLDSLALVELSMTLSQRLGIEITDDELYGLDTLADIAALMQQRIPAPEPGSADGRGLRAGVARP
jgi:acyl carrier protein